MPSGGREFNFTKADNLTLYEARDLDFLVVDGNENPIVSMAGWEYAFFIVQSMNDYNGLIALTANAPVAVPNGQVDGSAAPIATVSLTATDWPDKARKYFYEFWRADAGNETRLAWGEFPIIP